MPMRWVASKGFSQKPYSCVGCGQSPMITNEDGSTEPAEVYVLEGSDVNWGDTLQLCGSCVRILGELHGMLEPDKVRALEKEIRDLTKKLEESDGERDEYKSLNERMISGARARKSSKEKVNA
jgi:hypothetical protein